MPDRETLLSAVFFNKYLLSVNCVTAIGDAMTKKN